MSKMKVRGVCTHISCNQPCKTVQLNLEENIFNTLIQQAPSDDKDHFLYKDCQLFNAFEFEILSIDGSVIAGRSDGLLDTALVKNSALKSFRATARNQDQERHNELFDIAKALAREGVSPDRFSELSPEDKVKIKEGIT